MIARPATKTWERLTLLGIVQGVGMRPFVARLADRHGLAGTVCNAGAHLVIEVGGSSRQISEFKNDLVLQAPPAARIVRLTAVPSAGPPADFPDGFSIAESQPADGLVLISPDLAICPACERELRNPADRRFEHALISCMHCGPRFSILEALPYDRSQTTLRDFPLCPECQAEYSSRQDRRYHAQTVSCPNCGPQIRLGELQGRAALDQATVILTDSGILAVKGIGGYLLVCRPDSEDAIARLRRVKRREEKPFAVQFANLDQLASYADLTQEERDLLISPARPIVLVQSRDLAAAGLLHPLVSAGSSLLGAFLPAAPLQAQLTGRLGPLVMTSANLSGDMICTDDAEMAAFALKSGLDGVLAHNRAIACGLDDSVLRIADGRPLMMRRARGYVPLPVDLAAVLPGMPAGQSGLPQLVAAGSDLKATFALVRDGLCYPGVPVGDLGDQRVSQTWLQQLDRFTGLLALQPSRLIIDNHPDYQSAALARQRFPDLPVMAVQHHQAHIASVLAENPGHDAVLGVAFDGTGYGLDGTIWGGEWLIVRGLEMTRPASLRPIHVAGGDQGRKRAWQSLACYLSACGFTGEQMVDASPCLASRADAVLLVGAACRERIGTVPSSSMGTLFDAVCAMLGFGDFNHYEGQCGQNLEQAAAEAAKLGLLPWPLADHLKQERLADGRITLDAAPLFPALIAALAEGADRRSLALGFHEALASQVAAICRQICLASQLKVVALSGGCFQNVILLETTTKLLRLSGLEVLTNRQVSPGDGGLALGQIWLGLQEEINHSSLSANLEE